MDGNCRVPDGTNARNVKTRVNAVKPDAIYFTVKDGEMTMIAGVDILREDGRVAIPPTALAGRERLCNVHPCTVTFRSTEIRKGKGNTSKGPGVLKLCSFSFLW